MLPIKIDLTEELATTLRQLRLNNPIDGEILTAENLSKAIGNNRAWMSQIESRRLKKIKREDIIKIYKLLYNEPDEHQAEYHAEIDLAKFYTNSNSPLLLSSNSNLEDIFGFEEIPEESADYYNKQSFTFLMDALNETLSEKFIDLLQENNFEKQSEFLYLLSRLTNNINYAYEDTRMFLDKLPLELLQYATQEERQDILNKLDYISDLLLSFNIRYTEHRFIERMNNHKNNQLVAKDIQSLIFGLTELSNLVEKNDIINGSIVSYINDFISIVKKYYLSKNIPVPIAISELDNNSQKSDWINTIDKLQLLLSDSKDSKFFIRGKLTKNNP